MSRFISPSVSYLCPEILLEYCRKKRYRLSICKLYAATTIDALYTKGQMLNARQIFSRPVFTAIFLFILTLITGCGGSAVLDNKTVLGTGSDRLSQQLVKQYASIAAQAYMDSWQSTRALQQAIGEFTNSPSVKTHLQAKQTWLAARRVYGQTEVFRFYGGPIDDGRGLEAQINAWPIDEAYLDYVQSFDGKEILYQGLIADTEHLFTAAAIIDANERDGEKNISMGFHAIEFLLWGQDLFEHSSGQRSYQDYVGAPNANRRSQYLNILSDLLVAHLETLVNDWRPNTAGNYHSKFIDDPNALDFILTGMQVLAGNELAGERLEVALETYDQEDEHSCFSDNTHVDVNMNIQGIMNVYQGRYLTLSGELMQGVGVDDWLQRQDKQVGKQATAALEQAVNLANTIQPPFDQAILDSRQRETIEALVWQLRLFTRTIKTQQIRLRAEAGA